jgi:hypothetical protein
VRRLDQIETLPVLADCRRQRNSLLRDTEEDLGE